MNTITELEYIRNGKGAKFMIYDATCSHNVASARLHRGGCWDRFKYVKRPWYAWLTWPVSTNDPKQKVFYDVITERNYTEKEIQTFWGPIEFYINIENQIIIRPQVIIQYQLTPSKGHIHNAVFQTAEDADKYFYQLCKECNLELCERDE